MQQLASKNCKWAVELLEKYSNTVDSRLSGYPWNSAAWPE